MYQQSEQPSTEKPWRASGLSWAPRLGYEDPEPYHTTEDPEEAHDGH